MILLRYGWGLEPSQVCGLIEGLSPRAYRKEITRGVDQVTERMRALESGDWCRQREPILKAFAVGTADEDQERQARAHLAHCRECGEFVGRLRGHLHDLGAAVVAPAAIDGLGGQVTIVDRVLETGERARELGSGLIARVGSAPAEEGAAQVAAAGGVRGAGAAGAGVLAKLAGIGTAGKLAAVCLGGGAAATACIAAGVGPIGGLDRSEEVRPQETRTQEAPKPSVVATPVPVPTPEQVDNPPVAAPSEDGATQSSVSSNQQPGAADEDSSAAAPVAPDTPPTEQEFGVAPAAAPVSPTPAPAPASTGGDGDGGSASAARQEFAP